MDTPALVVGTTDGSRLEIGALAYGIEISGEAAAFRLTVRNGKLVIALGEGDSFLRQLPGGNIEVPFEVSLVRQHRPPASTSRAAPGCGSTCRCRPRCSACSPSSSSSWS